MQTSCSRRFTTRIHERTILFLKMKTLVLVWLTRVHMHPCRECGYYLLQIRTTTAIVMSSSTRPTYLMMRLRANADSKIVFLNKDLSMVCSESSRQTLYSLPHPFLGFQSLRGHFLSTLQQRRGTITMVVAQGIRDSTAPWRYLRSIESGALYFARCGMGFLSEKSQRGDGRPYIQV